MTDWSAYDTIAGRYDEAWGGRFEAVARLVWERVPPAHGAAVLDIGTGTGIVPHALGARAVDMAIVIGCDRSTGMIRVARARMSLLRPVAADAVSLPFRHSAFDVVTASFVLSHLSDYEAGLAEVRRVLKPGGLLALTSWAAGEDGPSEVWSRLLTGVVGAERVEAAFARVAPSMSRFEDPPGVERSLTRAGFAKVTVEAHAIESRLSVEQFIADRELTTGARYARHVLEVEEWDRLLVRARDELGRRFGPELSFSRGVLIGVASLRHR
jgi:ubiquinone/menaquinone biosynthesis C-methylase UbiE